MAQQIDIVANLLMKTEGVEAGIKKVQSSLSSLKIPSDLNQKFVKSFSNLEGIISRFKNQLNSGFNTKSDVSNITKIGKEIDVEFTRISKHFNELTGQSINFKVNSSEIVKAEQELNGLIQKKQEIAKDAIKLTIKTPEGKSGNITELLQGIQREAGKTKAGDIAKDALIKFNAGDITGYLNAIEKLAAAYRNLRSEQKKTAEVSASGITMGQAVNALTTQANEAKKALSGVEGEINQTKNSLAGLRTNQLDAAAKAARSAAASVDSLGVEMRQTGAAAKELGNSSYNMSKQLGDLRQSTQYFFGLRNMINLLRRGVDQAVESVKTLDKAMTETAVVTNFSVADMWRDLPKYTKLANELGATTQGAYETMTLYYQQGLDQQATFEIGAETMKMARIAGLDYAQTTDMMTAALRGFNMELNEVSAQRINDVYSNLAAKTASNTQELGEAMERTASIAHSAGMSFEGTAAFLAQMIETTREAPENLGTAMKTIVARFQELKKNPLEISEVEGEEVSFNKIDAALKTIGVDLVATNGQFRNLDEVFLDISKKWGSLTQMQQRYIATVSAGSRQQSRFIAMVGNYDRTMELMEYANESAGASQEQFNKTLDSFEAKMNRLQNAWQQFTMSIANNTFVKGAVDGITLVLDTVNKLIDTLSGGNGVIKSFLSIFTAFTGLKIAGRAINGLIGGLGGMLDPSAKGGFGKGMRTGALGAGANRITTPIVSKLGDILNAVNGIKNKGIKTEKASNARYEDRNSSLRGIVKGGKVDITNVREQFKSLSKEDQLRLFQSNRGTMNAIQRSGFKMMDSAFTDNPKMQMLGKTIQADIFKGMAKGQIKPEVGLKALGNPSSWGAIAGTDAAKGFSANYSQKMEEAASKARDWMKQNYYKSVEQIQKEDPKTRKESAEAYKTVYQRRLAEEKENLGLGSKEGQAQLSRMDKLANAASGVGGAFVGAGQSISSFGYILTQVGGPVGALGSAIQSLGGIVTSFGMAIGGIGSAISGLGTAAAAMGTTLGAIAGPLAAVAIGIGAIGWVVHKAIKENNDIKKSAKEVADTYDKTTKRIEKNRTTLKNFQGDWERLVQGVDSNGMNVSLEQADYDKYQEMVQKIADVNPAIIEGFNAQGKAIITNNKALSETLQLLEDQEKQARKTYTSDESFKKVISARNINKAYRKATEITGVQSYNTVYGTTYGVGTSKAKTPMQSSVQDIATTLKDKDFDIDVDKVLSRYNISLKQIEAGEEKAIKTFVKNQDSINADIQVAASEAGENATKFYTDELEKSFTSLSKDTAKFNKAIQPTIDLLAARLTDSKAYENVAPEMRAALMSGLEGIAAEDKSYKDIISDAESFATELGDITAEGSEYAEAMEAAASAQEHYADTLNINAYTDETKEAIKTLEALEEKYERSGESYSQALAEHLHNQIEKIKNFTEEGSVSLSEALNTMTYRIQSAEQALENFQEATKTDYSTAAQGMKSIYDEIFKETELESGEKAQLHLQGYGDRTFQTGAISLLGREAVADIYQNKSGIDAEQEIEKRLKKLEPMLQEGADGAEIFWNKLLNLEGKEIPDGVKIDKELQSLTIDPNNQEAFHKLAESLGMSDDLLTSMLNKLQQFADVSFSNIGDVRKALSVDEGVIGGLNGEQKKLYVRREHLEGAMTEAGYSPQQMAREEKNLEKNGNIVIIDEPVKLDKSSLEDMGITDMTSAIEVLGDTGQYTKEEIFDVAKKFGAEQDAFNDRYKEYLDSSKDPSLPSVQSIENTVQSIYQLLASNLVQSGNYTKGMSKDSEFKQQIWGKKGADTIPQLFSKGLDDKENELTEKTYKQTRDELEKYKGSMEEWLAQLENGQSKVEKGSEEYEAYQAEIDTTTEWIKRLADYMKAGDEEWGEIKEKNEQKKKEKQKEKEEEERQQQKAEEEKNKYEQSRSEKKSSEKKKSEKEETETKTDNVSEAQAKNDQLYQDKKKRLEDEARKNSEIAAKTAANEAAKKEASDREYQAIQERLQKEEAEKAAINSAYIGSTKTPAIETPEPEPPEEPDTNPLNQSVASYVQAAWQKIKETYETASAESNFEKPDYSKTEKEIDKVGKLPKDSLISKFSNWFKEVTSGVQKNAEQNLNYIPVKQTAPGMPSNARPNQEAAHAAMQGQNEGTTVAKVTVDNAEGIQKLEEIKAKATEAKTTIEAGATFSVTVEDKGLSSAAKKASAITAVEGNKNVSVTATTSGIDDTVSLTTAVKNFRKLKDKTVNLKVKVEGLTSIGSAIAAVKRFYDLRDDTVTLTTVSKKRHQATGARNHGYAPAPPQMGSMARGSYGQLGPKGRGGLTLTGELGYEIAWIPSENRSMILGANGPQMIDLPGDAVVWTHEQSKKIVKQKSIPAGSHSNKGTSVTASNPNFSNNRTVDSNQSAQNDVKKAAATVTASANKTKKKIDDTAKKVEKDSGNAVKAVRAVSVWWENIARKTDGAQRKMDKSAEAFEKYIKEMRATLKKTGQSLKSGGGGGDAYIKNMGKVLGYNQKQLKQANKELRALDKKRHKNVKGGYKKGSVAAMEISYETGKGDKKKTKIDYVNTAGYIKYDKKNGTYVIDQKKLNKIKNKDKRQAVADELNKRLDDEIKKRDAAKDAIEKVNEALEKMKEELYNTFFGWETELTKIWNLTQQIDAITSKIDRNKSYGDLLKARFSVDENFSMEEYAKQMLENFRTGIEKQQEKIKKDSDMIDLRRNGLLDLVNQTTDRENLKEVKARLKNDETVSTAKANKEKADERVKKLEAKRKKNLKTLAIYSNAEYQTPAMKKEIQKLEKETAQTAKKLKSAKANQKKANATLKEVQKKYGSSVLNDTERAGYEEYVERTAKQINTRNRAFKYMDVSRNADGTLNIDFDTEAFEKDKLNGKISEEAAKEIQDYVKELVEQSEGLDDAINTLTEDLEQQYSDLAELKEQWTDYAKQLWEMSEEEQKQEADRIKKLSDSIAKALKDLLDGVKRKLDERRQKEDNAKTERSISQKQQRLAMLRADTAGGHAVEIAQLENEIAEAQQDYQRTLEDQLLEKLQNQADEASKQREQMISLLEAQIENSNNAEKVDMWMANPEKFEEEIKNAFYAKMAPDYDKMPKVLKEDVDKDWKDFWTGITTNQEKQKDLQEKITANAAALDTLKTAAEGLSTVLEEIKAGANVSAGTGTGGGKGGGGKENPPITPTKAQQKIIDTFNSGPSALVDAKIKTLVKGKDYSWQSVFEALKLDEKYGGNESAVIQQIHRIFGKKSTRSKAFLDAYQKVFNKAYATGGLANYTGPAWLDGTPTKPELVLNATDTRNFLALKDVLSRAIGAVDSTVSTGDATYEININVDHLNSDYDVDRVAQRVKKIIVSDSSYRNVTQVRNFR